MSQRGSIYDFPMRCRLLSGQEFEVTVRRSHKIVHVEYKVFAVLHAMKISDRPFYVDLVYKGEVMDSCRRVAEYYEPNTGEPFEVQVVLNGRTE